MKKCPFAIYTPKMRYIHCNGLRNRLTPKKENLIPINLSFTVEKVSYLNVHFDCAKIFHWTHHMLPSVVKYLKVVLY